MERGLNGRRKEIGRGGEKKVKSVARISPQSVQIEIYIYIYKKKQESQKQNYEIMNLIVV